MLVYGECECFVMQMVYVCVLCASCGSSQCCVLHDLQRATLSQLRSGHCKLLNSYKKRLKQTDSLSCPDCGMDPQDVPHLFNCTAHPTALTPENVWNRPVKTIRELSFLDPENLDYRRGWLKRAYNNNQPSLWTFLHSPSILLSIRLALHSTTRLPTVPLLVP